MNKKVITSPFRWTGSKRRLLNEILTIFDSSKNIYIEPFLGSGIVLLNVLELDLYKEYYVNDINQDIINFYLHVKNHCDLLEKRINQLCILYNDLSKDEKKKYFYELRKKYNQEKENTIERSSLFWFMMKCGFNGVYRVNLSGEFNVPFGYKEKINLKEGYLKEISNKISNVNFYCMPYDEFFEILNQMSIKQGFIYCDPPYIPKSKSMINQTLYTKERFNHSNFIDETFQLSSDKSFSIMISMDYSEEANELYSKRYKVSHKVKELIRLVNPNKLVKSEEMIYMNYYLKESDDDVDR